MTKRIILALTLLMGVSGAVLANGQCQPFVDSARGGEFGNGAGDRHQPTIPGCDEPILRIEDKCGRQAIGQ